MANKHRIQIFRITLITLTVVFIFLITTSIGYGRPMDESMVNLTLPGKLSIYQHGNGKITTEEFVVENNSPLDFTINKITATSFNGWNLVDSNTEITPTKKNVLLSICKNQLKNGENVTDIPIAANSKNNLIVDADMAFFDKDMNEKAFNLLFDYTYTSKEFAISFDPGFNENIEPIIALNGTNVKLPEPKTNSIAFMGWKDLYTGKMYHNSMIMPIGGTRLIAIWEEAVLSISRFKEIPPMIGGGIENSGQSAAEPKKITGITFKEIIDIPKDCERWDLSKKLDKSVMAYRTTTDRNAPDYNDIIIAANTTSISLDGSNTLLFASENHDTPLKFIHSEGVTIKILDGIINQTFRGCKSLTDISGLKYLDTSNINSMFGMFFLCSKMEDYSPIKDWNTSKVIDMSWMFCINDSLLTCEAMENWDMSNVKFIDNMFSYSYKLYEADLTNWNLDNLFEKPTYGAFGDVRLKVALCGNEKYVKFLNMNRGENHLKFAALHTINFDLDGDGVYDLVPIKAYTGNNIILDIPEKEGYRFVNWKDQYGNYYEKELVVPNKDLILTAQWKLINAVK